MTTEEKLALAKQTISDEIKQLEDWTRESCDGGWSTHQVKPQQERASQLSLVLWQIGGPE